MGVPRTKTGVQALLGAHGLSPRRMAGQHFLVDGNLIDAIVRAADVGPGDAVLEVGTGTGILTDALADRAGAVVTCDVDPRMQAAARAARDWPDHVRFLEEDVLRGKHALNDAVIDAWRAAGEGRRLRVVANLPYAVATPFLANLLWSGMPCADATVLVQREAAERFTAVPDTPAYGAMSVAVALLADARITRRVGPHVFWPPPRVESAVLHLAVRDPARADELREAGLPELLRTGFLHRRKTLKKAFPAARLAAAGLDPGARPGEIPPEGWVALLTVRPS